VETRFHLEGIKHEVENRWCVFRDSAINAFLLAYFDQRISELVRSLENVTPEGLARVQGEVAEARKCREFLARTTVAVAMSELINKLKEK
jgi:hypothetical protein